MMPKLGQTVSLIKSHEEKEAQGVRKIYWVSAMKLSYSESKPYIALGIMHGVCHGLVGEQKKHNRVNILTKVIQENN